MLSKRVSRPTEKAQALADAVNYPKAQPAVSRNAEPGKKPIRLGPRQVEHEGTNTHSNDALILHQHRDMDSRATGDPNTQPERGKVPESQMKKSTTTRKRPRAQAESDVEDLTEEEAPTAREAVSGVKRSKGNLKRNVKNRDKETEDADENSDAELRKSLKDFQ